MANDAQRMPGRFVETGCCNVTYLTPARNAGNSLTFKSMFQIFFQIVYEFELRSNYSKQSMQFVRIMVNKSSYFEDAPLPKHTTILPQTLQDVPSPRSLPPLRSLSGHPGEHTCPRGVPACQHQTQGRKQKPFVRCKHKSLWYINKPTGGPRKKKRLLVFDTK